MPQDSERPMARQMWKWKFCLMIICAFPYDHRMKLNGKEAVSIPSNNQELLEIRNEFFLEI